MKKILAADIGGTNSRFAHFTFTVEADGKLTLADVKWLPTENADYFGRLIEQLRSSDFSRQGGGRIDFVHLIVSALFKVYSSPARLQPLVGTWKEPKIPVHLLFATATTGRCDRCQDIVDCLYGVRDYLNVNCLSASVKLS